MEMGRFDSLWGKSASVTHRTDDLDEPREDPNKLLGELQELRVLVDDLRGEREEILAEVRTVEGERRDLLAQVEELKHQREYLLVCMGAPKQEALPRGNPRRM